ncbi:hypothetical protein CHLNCDRAFT_48894 [Chlorella variabilis]|uniref:BioF2-like acetyltransferase domain-containing protein n=1 Tax=Chlorella variabilis TaxID=554065 RepID=E1ZH00_CHLVA|nr:hypothetical protein CHLNCDRAFT_48894 [Chlorella variabilis]EFN55029.1 hypothetical protein CHLNCDRAFT_48894 [Chlorella variabilis]|eukprot:XP_005847131.1 hypothetical protein CHLNCDRAFT_48894 [Chlorella variabilis]
MEHVSKEEWDACATAGGEVNPFLLHDFLHALEASGSAVKEEGWLPQHVLVRRGDSGELLGCCPMYLKGHSYGEYVFDSSWANAYHRMMGQNYYPKLLVGVPFTPVPGQRLLVKAGPHADAVRGALADTLKQVADQFGVSSLHINFATQEEWGELGAKHGYLQRTGLQYHCSFDDAGDERSFLMSLRQSKRKSIRQERKKAAQEGLRFLRLTGADIQPRHWDAFHRFYLNTTDRKWGSAYLTRDFFSQLGERMGYRVLLVLAETADGAAGHGRPIAGALNLIGSHALFGRNWGCLLGDRIPNLHFELCYYQACGGGGPGVALEFAIERGLQRVEAGAQGEHKLQRGYVPSLTHSLHYLPDPGFAGVVDRYLQQERAEMEYTLRMLRCEASPYKQA